MYVELDRDIAGIGGIWIQIVGLCHLTQHACIVLQDAHDEQIAVMWQCRAFNMGTLCFEK